jgi:hypothetical protein
MLVVPIPRHQHTSLVNIGLLQESHSDVGSARQVEAFARCPAKTVAVAEPSQSSKSVRSTSKHSEICCSYPYSDRDMRVSPIAGASGASLQYRT